MKVSVIVAAAGRGERFGGKRNKILEKVKGRAIFLHSLELFSARDDVCEILLVINPDDREEILEKFGPNIAFMNARVIDGGPTRTDSIRNALAEVCTDCDFVAVHDAARPCVSQLWIDDIFKAASETLAAIPATPVHGTLKLVDVEQITETSPQALLGGEPIPGLSGNRTRDAYFIRQTVDRSGLWQAQTPQVFSRDLIMKAYESATDSATDDAGLVENLGHKVAIVPGDMRNIKITTPGDLKLAESLIGTLPKPKPKTDGSNPFGDAMW